MTMALCFNCGAMKFGALGPCPECQSGASGKIDLDIAFSDQNYTITTLEQLGGVIKEIHRHCDDPTTCFWTFIYYVSDNHPDTLNVDFETEGKLEHEAILSRCTLPNVVVEDSPSRQFKKGAQGSGGSEL